MSDTGGTEETTDYSKMKVNDLKKILKNRGLAVTGNKQELVDRLQSSEATAEDLLDGSEVGDELVADDDLERELDESTLLIGDDMDKTDDKKDSVEKAKPEATKEEAASSTVAKTAITSETTAKPPDESPANGPSNDQEEVTNTTQQKRKISLKGESDAANDAAKKKLRAERFGAGGETASTEVLAKRAERFAINSTTTSTAVSDKAKLSQSEALKKRAERFGILSPAEQKRQLLEKMQARKARFASGDKAPAAEPDATTTATATIAAVPVVLPSGVKPTQLTAEERKKLRAQRFNNK